ncbi:alpha/beta fold hydrolase [Corallococcus aberystwythensis]|uniref:Alpha/beta fold hydrolase n=1 Tax=Corallococcus aberystwythensis TaxID=2316722 RepID=A0A3A8RBU8_9BACT|nr:alpha/beta hydrolase [Corallococcus aberystwythensis]RKH74772.1 alpha/beta fold hydrolase [Corallococcus aberystwythensis]
MRTSWFRLSWVLLLSACATTPSPPPGDPVDPLHQVRRVKVAPEVELEVLDYGGKGPALVFLPGLGSTGHVYDVLAPEFTATHHVYAFTRRGFGASSWPATGYDSATLGHDVLAALDGLGLQKVTLAGHSLAGDELNWMGVNHPERVEAFIFLDATENRGEIAHFLQPGPLPPLPFTVLDGQPSREAVTALLARDLGGPFPPHEIDQAYEFDAGTGAYLRYRRLPEATEQSVRGAAEPDFAKLRAPVLAISDDQAFAGWVAYLSQAENVPADLRERAQAFLPELRQHEAAQEALLKSLPNWKLVMLPGAGHYLWLTRQAEVISAMRAFLAR